MFSSEKHHVNGRIRIFLMLRINFTNYCTHFKEMEFTINFCVDNLLKMRFFFWAFSYPLNGTNRFFLNAVAGKLRTRILHENFPHYSFLIHF